MVATLLFYLFSLITILSALAVVSARNPVHAVLFLILAFFNAAGLFVLQGAELIAMLLVIVYVGAVAVLFLFVVMMLNINFVRLKEGFLRYLPIGGAVALLLLAELVMVLYAGTREMPAASGLVVEGHAVTTNTQAIGRVLYTDYIYLFQLAGMILLVAMIGAIVLTYRRREGVRRQDATRQLARHRKDTLEIVKVKSGSGIQG